MIFSLSGAVKHVGAAFAVIETGGIGYQVFATPDTLSLISASAKASADRRTGAIELWISHLITDSSQTLYGFRTLEEREFFEQLLTVSGVGGKTAINIMGLAPLADLQAAIRSGDPSLLTRVSGVGKRTAERIVVELKEKLGQGSTMSVSQGDAFEALQSLGYKTHDIREALRATPTANTEAMIKEALKKLGSARK